MTTTETKPSSIKFLGRYFLLACICGAPSLFFPQSTIHKLELNGTEVGQVELTIALPKQQPRNMRVSKNQKFSSGTLFAVPANTVVWLESNANRQRLGPGSRHMATAGPKGESHKTFWGSVTHYVQNKLNFYKASGPSNKQQGAVKGTTFTVSAVGKDVKFSTAKGRVAISQKVGLNIKEQSQNSRNRSQPLETTKTSYLDAGSEQLYYHDSNEQITFASYEEAITTFQQELDKLYLDGEDAEFIVEYYTLLGELLLDDERYEDAIEAFETAIELYEEELDPYDPLLADNYLGLAEAFIMAGYQDDGIETWNKAIDFIGQDLETNQIDLNYFIEIEDYDTAWGIGLDVVDNFYNLGWAYYLINDTENGDKFFALARQLEAELN